MNVCLQYSQLTTNTVLSTKMKPNWIIEKENIQVSILLLKPVTDKFHRLLSKSSPQNFYNWHFQASRFQNFVGRGLKSPEVLQPPTLIGSAAYFTTFNKREHVQIMSSGHADANQSGADFLQFRFWSVPIMLVPHETETAMGQTSSRGQLTEIIKSWLTSVSIYQGVETGGHS